MPKFFIGKADSKQPAGTGIVGVLFGILFVSDLLNGLLGQDVHVRAGFAEFELDLDFRT